VYLTGNAEGIVDYKAWQEMGRTVSSSIVEKTVVHEFTASHVFVLTG
jgi:hypothetical protein